MEVNTTPSSTLERQVKLAIPGVEFEKRVKDRLRSLAGSVRIDGFRPGKVPMTVVERRFGSQIRSEIKQDLLETAFRKVVSEQQLRPVGQPEIRPESEGHGASQLDYVATFEVFPQIQVAIPPGAAVQKPVVSVADSDIDAVIERIRKQAASWQEVDRGAQLGDRINVDFVGTIDGEPFDGGEAQDYNIVLGSKVLVGDFEQQLIGSLAGDEKTISVKFPEDYPAERLRGQTPSFRVSIKRVDEPKLPEINDEFLQKFGVSQGDINEFRKQVRESVEREVKEAVQSRLKDQVVELLLKNIQVELPKALIANELVSRMQRVRAQLAANGIAPDKIRLDESKYIDGAKRSVALGLIIAEILRTNGIKVAPEEVTAEIQARASTYDDPSGVVKWYLEDRSRVADLEALLLENKAVDWVLGQAQIREENMSVKDLLETQEGRVTG